MNRFISIVIILGVVSGCARDQRMISHFPDRPISTEHELGEAINQRIMANIPACTNVQVTHYVQSVGEVLASHAARKDLQYRFVVLEDDRIHATHAPGGFVYITTGFLEFLQSEIELAGVLAYELAALHRKDPRLSAVMKTKDFVLQAGSVAAPAFGPIGALSLLGLIAINELAMSDPSLIDKVKRADARALTMMTSSGYDPQGFLNVLHRINDPQSKSRPYLFDYLESHPMPRGRESHLNEVFQKLPLADKQFDARREVFLTVQEALKSHA